MQVTPLHGSAPRQALLNPLSVMPAPPSRLRSHAAQAVLLRERGDRGVPLLDPLERQG